MTTGTLSADILDSAQVKGAVTISKLMLLKQLGHIVIPEYQRSEVWTKDQKRKFICAILDMEPSISHITIHRVSDRLHIVDGQQRLSAISEYVNDELMLSAATLQENGLDISLKGKFTKLPDDVQQRVLNFSLDYKVTNDPRKSFLRLQNAKPLNTAERNHALECDLNECLTSLTEDYKDLISRCGFDNKRFKADEAFAGCLYMAVHGRAANTPKAIQAFYRDFDSKKYEEALQETRDILFLMKDAIDEKSTFLGAANFRALFLLLLKSDPDTRNMYGPLLGEFLKACATNEELKSARNRLGEEHLQKDALEEAFVKFIAKEGDEPTDEEESEGKVVNL